MTAIEDRPTLPERYARAMQSTHLEVLVDERCSVDLLVAAGWASTREPKRRRECTTCGYRWSTVELSAEEVGKLRADGVRLARVRVLANEGRS